VTVLGCALFPLANFTEGFGKRLQTLHWPAFFANISEKHCQIFQQLIAICQKLLNII
jgi:hypothetical protein